jgi:PAS domain S-box-containing protein
MLDFAPIMMRDIDGAVTFWSEGCHQLYGWTAEQAIGRSSNELLQTVGLVPFDEIEAELLSKGEWSGELRQRRQDGAAVVVLAHKLLLRVPDGSRLGVKETVTDVTALRQSEAALEASRMKFRSVVDAAADAIVVAHASGRIETVNKTALRMFGYDSVEALIGRDLGMLMPSTEASRHGSYIASHVAGAPPRVISVPGRELLAVRQDGSEFPIELSVSSFGTGPERYLTGIIRDASVRKRVEMALRASEQQLRQFIDEAPAAIAMFDTAMCYLAASRRFVSDYHIGDRADLAGRSHYDIFPEISDNWLNVHRRVLAGETLSSEAEPFPRADGSIHWVRWEMAPWRSVDGTIGGATLFSEDVTARKAAEVALHDSEARLRLVQQISGVAYTDRAFSSTVALISGEFAAIYGLPPEQRRIEVADIIARFHPDDRERIAAISTDSLEHGGKFAAEFRICRPDETIRCISLRTEAFLGPDGRPNRIVSAQQDITEIVATRDLLAARHKELERLSRHLAKARDQADLANRAKSRFLAGMSHELRTPLNGIIGYAHLLRMEGTLTPVQTMRVDAMLAAGSHLLQMIMHVLDLSEIEAEHVELRPVEFDVLAAAAACLDLVRPTAELKRLTLNIAVEPGTRRELTADPVRLRQVLLNLLGNAVKFTGEGGVTLRLRTLPDGSALLIEVADTGPGIPAELKQRLFQDFARLDTPEASTVEGAGLGLAIAARLVMLIGGRLGHEDNPDGGSIFWVELPLGTMTASLPAAASDAGRAGSQPGPEPARVLHVLVVDDVAMNRDIAGSFLRAGGHETTCAESGAQAIAAVAATDFDVVLMDVRMPEMDGLEATRRIRALEDPRGRVPIVAVTAQAFTEQVAECRKAGMDGHLSKPYDPAQLLAAVMSAAALRVKPERQAQQLSSRPEPRRSSAVVPGVPAIGEDLLVVNQQVFERNAALLKPEAVARYMKTIAEGVQSLLCGLREPDALTRTGGELSDAAHALAGSAGMFGFERLAALGRRFERAMQTGAAETPALADGLAAALEATLPIALDRSAIAGDNRLEEIVPA